MQYQAKATFVLYNWWCVDKKGYSVHPKEGAIIHGNIGGKGIIPTELTDVPFESEYVGTRHVNFILGPPDPAYALWAITNCGKLVEGFAAQHRATT